MAADGTIFVFLRRFRSDFRAVKCSGISEFQFCGQKYNKRHVRVHELARLCAFPDSVPLFHLQGTPKNYERPTDKTSPLGTHMFRSKTSGKRRRFFFSCPWPTPNNSVQKGWVPTNKGTILKTVTSSGKFLFVVHINFHQSGPAAIFKGIDSRGWVTSNKFLGCPKIAVKICREKKL